MLKSVAHGNGVTVTHGLDPHAMRRPGSIATSGVTGTPGNWDSGAYAYDGVGNITRIGEEWYTYDLVSRLAANSYPEQEGECPTSLQSLAYTYDPLGNMTSWTYNCSGTHTYAVDPSTNRLTTQTYDPAGNVLTTVGEANMETLAYYPFNDLRSAVGTGLNRLYGTTADGERLVDYDEFSTDPAGPFTITLRDLGGKVLRSFQVTTGSPGTWTEKEDWITRDGQLLATVDTTVQGGVARHVHLDHLGTPRLITSASGAGLESHTYLPFGLEVTEVGPLFERMKFTGHERDLTSGLDYLHARYYSPYVNRFLSVDTGRAKPGSPQGWNRYAYAHGNPLKFTDPDGKEIVLAVRDNSGGGKNNYGHTALRVVGSGYDKTYDFGRYGHVDPWLTTGDGVLRVWSNWNAFAKGQALHGRLSTVTFKSTPAQDQAVMDFFQARTDAGQRLTSAPSPNHTDFKLTTNYDLFNNNCTTVSLQGLGAANAAEGPPIENYNLFKDLWKPENLQEELDELFGERLVMVTNEGPR